MAQHERMHTAELKILSSSFTQFDFSCQNSPIPEWPAHLVIERQRVPLLGEPLAVLPPEAAQHLPLALDLVYGLFLGRTCASGRPCPQLRPHMPSVMLLPDGALLLLLRLLRGGARSCGVLLFDMLLLPLGALFGHVFLPWQ